MKILFLLVAAPLMASLAQPAKNPLQPARPSAKVDSHLVKHPKAKPSAFRTKSVSPADSARSSTVTRTQPPTVKPTAKPRKP